MNKIKTMAAATMLAAAMGASAQSVDALGPAPRQGQPYWGLRLGLDMSTLTGDPYQIAPGWSVGAVYDVPIKIGDFTGLYVEPGASLYFDRWGVDKNAIALDQIPGVEIGGEEYPRTLVKSAYLQTWGLRIPLVAGLRFASSDNLNFTFSTGPELGIGFQNKEHVNFKIEDMDVNTSQSVYGDYGYVHRADLAWKFAVGANWYRLHFDVSASLGMTKMLRDREGDNSHLNRFALTLGYNF